MTDSSTGGYLSPAAAPAPLEGKALADFFQAWTQGITQLPGNMIRPAWQPEAPNIPDAGTVWASFQINSRPSDEYPYVGELNDGNGAAQLQRHETLNLLFSFYDLGIDGQADKYASILRDGTAIAQNREPLTLAGMGLVRAGELIPVPVLVKTRWVYRVTLEIVIRRQIDRVYPVLTLETADATLYTDGGLPPQPIVAGD